VVLRMTEYRFFEGDVAHVSTYEFHVDRERVAHLEQDMHRPRLLKARDFILDLAAAAPDASTLSDLGCGDGGLLSLIWPDIVPFAWGFDFCPANEIGWRERNIVARQADVFGRDWSTVTMGQIVVMTEVLEHLTDPHGVLRRLHEHSKPRYVVASSPLGETPELHCAEHAWGWGQDDYAKMFNDAGWRVIRHEIVTGFQVVLAERSDYAWTTT
jgi:trans-aconitate methyltransferase